MARARLALRCLTVRGGIVTGAAAVVMALATAPQALAHAAFAHAQPQPGARLAQSPRSIRLDFTEPLNRSLSKPTLTNLSTGKHVSAHASASGRTLILRPGGALARAAYRVDWHTVSTRDGHPLDGFFSFGVRTAAAGGEHQVQLSPLARDGWVRVLARGIFYALLFFFAGGVIGAALLGSRADPAGWLVPDRSTTGGGDIPDTRRLWDRTLDAGWLAAAAAAGVAVIEAVDASGGLTLDGLNQYLLTNTAGLARVGVVVVTVLAALWASRSPVAATASLALAFLLISLGGHANSASPRGLAVVSDLVHLFAGAAWVGGIAQVAWCWLPQLRSAPRELRLAVMRSVLPRFGKVALPAFVVVVTAGLVNAVIQLGGVSALWNTSYGLVLGVKGELVGLIALASWTHALRLRPRLLAANPHPPSLLERRHWRLLRIEPVLGGAVVLAAALLVAFPLPPRQLKERDETATAAQPPKVACGPCPQRKPSPSELGIAEQAGSNIAAFWLRRVGSGLRGELRLLDSNEKPVSEPAHVLGARRQSGCGRGCWRFELTRQPATVAARVQDKGRPFVARVPARWIPGGERVARRLTRRAQRSMARLRGLRDEQVVTSGPGSLAVTSFVLEAPDRMAYRTDRDVQSITIGKSQWFRDGSQPWQRSRYGGGGPPFNVRSWFLWTAYARTARLLGYRQSDGRRFAEVALMDEATPVWTTFDIDLATMRVPRRRMITGGHFMTDRFLELNQPQRIRPPHSP